MSLELDEHMLPPYTFSAPIVAVVSICTSPKVCTSPPRSLRMILFKNKVTSEQQYQLPIQNTIPNILNVFVSKCNQYVPPLFNNPNLLFSSMHYF